MTLAKSFDFTFENNDLILDFFSELNVLSITISFSTLLFNSSILYNKEYDGDESDISKRDLWYSLSKFLLLLIIFKNHYQN